MSLVDEKTLYETIDGNQTMRVSVQGASGVGGVTISVTPRGEYDNSTLYNVGDIVSFEGLSYITIAQSTGNEPTDTDFWQILVSPGVISGENLFLECRNTTGSTIPKGSAVYVSGVNGNRPLISLAQADNGITSDQVIGLTSEDVPDNTNNRVVVFGALEGFDTSAFNEGDELYLSTSTPGGLTSTKPISPFHSIRIGVVTTSGIPNGVIEISIDVGMHLDDLHNVLIDAPLGDQVLTYEPSTLLWKNKSVKQYFESASKNIKSWSVSISKLQSGDIDTITYTNGTETIVKTFGYTSGDLTSITLSGDTPAGIDLVKTFTYTNGDLTGWSYS